MSCYPSMDTDRIMVYAPLGRVARGAPTASSTTCRLVQRHDLLGIALQLGAACGRRRVGGKEFRGRAAAAKGRHLLPECDRRPRIVAGPSRQFHADEVRSEEHTSELQSR